MPREDIYSPEYSVQPQQSQPIDKAQTDQGNQSDLFQQVRDNQVNIAQQAPVQEDKGTHWYDYIGEELVSNIEGETPENWDQMGQFEKMEWKNEQLKDKGPMIGKSLLKVPFKVAQTLYDISVGGRASLDKNRTAKDIYREEGIGMSYNLPWLGEVRGFGGSYAEGREMGLGKVSSAIKATGETSGDLAILYSMFQLGSSAFQERLVKSPGTKTITQKNTDRFVSKQTLKSKIETKIDPTATQKFGTGVQNQQSTYVKVAKNTAIKRTPVGQGQVEYTLVDIKGSVAKTAKDFFVKKFGKSNVTTGQYGTEIRLETIVKNTSQSTGAITTANPISPAAVTPAQATGGIAAGAVTKVAAERVATSGIVPPSAIPGAVTSPAVPEQGVNTFPQDAPVEVNAYNELNRIYRGEQESLGIEAVENLPEGITGKSAIDSIMQVAGPDGSIGATQDIARSLTSLGYTEPQVSEVSPIIDNTQLATGLTQGAGLAPEYQGVRDLAYKSTVENKGVTINLSGDVPVKGYAYSPYKGLETKVPVETFTKGAVTSFIQTNLPKLLEPGNHIGTWEEDGEIYLDISKVGPATPETITEAESAGQLGVFDLEKFETVFTKLHAKETNIANIDGGEISSTDPTGGGTGLQQLPGQETTGTATIAGSKPVTPHSERIIPSVMSKPLKGFNNKVVTKKQIGQIQALAVDRSLPDVIIRATVKVMTGKDSLHELDQDEAYKVSEAILAFNDTTPTSPDLEKAFMVRPWVSRTRDWMAAAEQELGVPVYSEVFMPIELATRQVKVFTDRWKAAAREVTGKHGNNTEEMRLVDDYVRGNKDTVLQNDRLTDIQKAELSEIGDWFIKQYKEQYLIMKKLYGKELDLGEFFGEYGPSLARTGGTYSRYKSNELPAELRPFFSFERTGMLSHVEDNALALFDVYMGATAKKIFLAEPVENAKNVIDEAPNYIRKNALSYLQEKLGYKDNLTFLLDKLSQKVSKLTNGHIPENVGKQSIDAAMSLSYAGALGGRPMPVVRNSMQSPLMNYPEFGPKWYAYGVKKALEPGGKQEVREAGFLVQSGVPYGSEVFAAEGKGVVGKSVDAVKKINAATLIPYASRDTTNRTQAYFSTKGRFDENWELVRSGKISYEDFEKNINLDGFNPVLQDMVRKRLLEGIDGDKTAVKEALNMMIQDKIDDTQFPYRKGSESRFHYGLGGKVALQFTQWGFEYANTLKKWISRRQWDKLIRWYAAGTAVKRTAEETLGIDASKWAVIGPMGGFGFGPLGKMMATGVGAMSSALNNIDDDVNKAWKDITSTMKIYGGIAFGVQSQKLQNFYRSVKRFEAGTNPSTDPDRPFMLYAQTSGKAIRFVDFAELLKVTAGFSPEEAAKQSEKIDIIKKGTEERANRMNEAMNAYMDGDYDKFNKIIIDNNLYIPDVQQSLRSYREELDSRIFDRLPADLKIKYFNLMYPMNQ